jgi:LmbE family N-acetylglucosaminyl deacetylase
METRLPAARRLVAVCAHPDDESFGLGAVLTAFAAAGTELALLCLTRGEASTLGPGAQDLAAVRSRELACAAAALGIGDVLLLDYPDGGLANIPLDILGAEVARVAAGADALLVFDEGGITGHPDHVRATAAAAKAAAWSGLPVYAWAIPRVVATALNAAFGTAFVGREASALDTCLTVDRARQMQAIACHRSQSTDNPVLWRRLALTGDREYLRILDGHGDASGATRDAHRAIASRACGIASASPITL